MKIKTKIGVGTGIAILLILVFTFPLWLLALVYVFGENTPALLRFFGICVIVGIGMIALYRYTRQRS